jgi:formylglycine-generating enzyme required for sulfatase activity
VGGELPSEAQWEYAATSLGQNIFYTWGNSIQSPTCYYANFFNPPSYCAPEGTTPICTSILGNTDQDLCDMIGNVQEWVLDDRHVSYEQAPANEQAWCIDVGICTQENLKTMRGGSWLSSQLSISTRDRRTTNQEYRIFDLGFRVIRPH